MSLPPRAGVYSFNNYLVAQAALGGFAVIGGCQEATGLTAAEVYRPNGSLGARGRPPSLRAGRTVTLKRGLISSITLFAWIEASRTAGSIGSLRMQLQNLPGTVTGTWKLDAIALQNWSGPALNSKTTVAAFEHITLSAALVTHAA